MVLPAVRVCSYAVRLASIPEFQQLKKKVESLMDVRVSCYVFKHMLCQIMVEEFQ